MKLSVIGLGPGDEAMMTAEALDAIEASDCIVGYGVYIDLIRHLIGGKEILTTPMKQEAAAPHGGGGGGFPAKTWPWYQRGRRHLWYGRACLRGAQ